MVRTWTEFADNISARFFQIATIFQSSFRIFSRLASTSIYNENPKNRTRISYTITIREGSEMYNKRTIFLANCTKTPYMYTPPTLQTVPLYTCRSYNSTNGNIVSSPPPRNGNKITRLMYRNRRQTKRRERKSK